MTKLKLCLAALGLSAAFIAGPASAAINWQTPFTIFEDDDLDFLYTPATDGSLVKDTDGIINEGDVLVAVFELNTAGGQSILPQEVTGISAIQVGSINELVPGSGVGNITFSALFRRLKPSSCSGY